MCSGARTRKNVTRCGRRDLSKAQTNDQRVSKNIGAGDCNEKQIGGRMNEVGANWDNSSRSMTKQTAQVGV